jgi:hypothetical protein
MPPSKVTLEDLLHLKRAERPAPEFWAQFERDLRQKQLAALVVRRSWWLEFSAVYGRYGRLRVPLGAAAVLALSVFTVRYYAGPGAVAPLPARGVGVRVPEVLAATRPMEKEKSARLALATRPAAAVEVAAAAGSAREAPATTEAGPVESDAVSTVIPWLGDVVDDRSATAELKPSARSIAVRLAAVAALEPDLIAAAVRPLGFEERAMPATSLRHTAEVLPTAAAVTDSRRTRLLAALGSAGVYTPEPAAPEHARRSVLRYLADDGWDRSMGRLEAEGDKLSIKF